MQTVYIRPLLRKPFENDPRFINREHLSSKDTNTEQDEKTRTQNRTPLERGYFPQALYTSEGTRTCVSYLHLWCTPSRVFRRRIRHPSMPFKVSLESHDLSFDVLPWTFLIYQESRPLSRQYFCPIVRHKTLNGTTNKERDKFRAPHGTTSPKMERRKERDVARRQR